MIIFCLLVFYQTTVWDFIGSEDLSSQHFYVFFVTVVLIVVVVAVVMLIKIMVVVMIMFISFPILFTIAEIFAVLCHYGFHTYPKNHKGS